MHDSPEEVADEELLVGELLVGGGFELADVAATAVEEVGVGGHAEVDLGAGEGKAGRSLALSAPSQSHGCRCAHGQSAHGSGACGQTCGADGDGSGSRSASAHKDDAVGDVDEGGAEGQGDEETAVHLRKDTLQKEIRSWTQVIIIAIGLIITKHSYVRNKLLIRKFKKKKKNKKLQHGTENLERVCVVPGED